MSSGVVRVVKRYQIVSGRVEWRRVSSGVGCRVASGVEWRRPAAGADLRYRHERFLRKQSLQSDGVRVSAVVVVAVVAVVVGARQPTRQALSRQSPLQRRRQRA